MEKTKIYLLKVNGCPALHEKPVPPDVRVSNQLMLRKAFGDKFNLVDCKEVENKDGETIFCEMLIKTTGMLNKQFLSDKYQVIKEMDESDV